MDVDESRQILLAFFRALADEDRIRLAAATVGEARRADELAAALGIARPAVMRHLALLTEAGIVREHGAGSARTYELYVDGLRAMRRSVLARGERLPESAADLDAERRAVLRAFFDGEMLKAIPVDAKKKLIVLEWLVERFDRGKRYPERDINAIIKRHHPDTAALRRELVDRGLMRRDAGVYWRVDGDA